MSRPGLLDWLCQAGKAVFKTERIPVDEKIIIRKNDTVTLDPAAILSANGGLEADSTGKIAVKTDGSLTKANNALGLSGTANAPTATKLKIARKIAIAGGATGTATAFNGEKDITIDVTALNVNTASAGTLATARGGTGRTDGKVTAWATARGIDGVNMDGSADIAHYGTCATAAATAAKVVALAGFKLVTGSRVAVRFTVSNTANNPTLNVNNTGAKAIRYRNAAIERYYLEANRTYEFIYDGTAWQLIGDLNCPYELCEFYYFRHPTLRSGFQPLTGGVIANANTKYPLAWAYLGTTEGAKLCKTESEWQALSTQPHYTLADGTKLGFNGIGGVPFYVRNTSNGSLRMPDIRGTYPEPAGFDSLNVGGVKLDGIRALSGRFVAVGKSDTLGGYPNTNGFCFIDTSSGKTQKQMTESAPSEYWAEAVFALENSRQQPISNAIRPRSFGVLPCAYLGQPQS